jgi:hypothetical protein
MHSLRVFLAVFATVVTSQFTSHTLAAGPYQAPGITTAYTLIPQSGWCEERIQRIERTLERIAKKVGVEAESAIGMLQPTRLVTRADGVTVLDESCLADSSIAVLDMIRQSQPKDETSAQLKELESRRAELLSQMLKAFDELRATDAKIEQLKQRTTAPE